MDTAVKPIFSHQRGQALIQSYGNAVRFNPNDTDLSHPISVIEQLAFDHLPRKLGATRILWQRLPNKSHPDRRFKVTPFDEGFTKDAGTLKVSNNRFDGVILTKPNQTVAFVTRDCPVLVLHAGHGSPIAVLHCGRDALQGFDLGYDRDDSVIAHAIAAIQQEIYPDQSLYGVVTMGIGADHFENDRYPEILTGLRDTWGKWTTPGKNGWRIDLLECIREQLFRYAGMMRHHVEWDGLDTYSDKRLASVRAGHDGYHNIVMVSHT